MVVMASATQMMFEPFSPQVLPDRAVIRVAGDGGLAFLHNLLTCELSAPLPAYGALLTPQGKILNDVFVVPDGDVIWIDVAAAQAADLHKRLVMYRLRAKLEIYIDPSKAVGVGMGPELPGHSYADPRWHVIGYRTFVDAAALPTGEGYHAARIASGLADSVMDIGSGALFVHEANLDQLHGVSFSKGCYVGQEVVSRTHHRHTARNRILPVRLDVAIENGTDITSGSQRIGTMLSHVGNHGLALMRLDRLAEAEAPLMAGDMRLHVSLPAWAGFDLVIPEVAS